MDKFGIFNLLNSFLKTNSDNQAQTSSLKTDKKPDFLSSLSSLLNGNALAEQPKNEQAVQTTPPKAFAPLQTKMLSTMTSHDEFVKRVNRTKRPPLNQ